MANKTLLILSCILLLCTPISGEAKPIAEIGDSKQLILQTLGSPIEKIEMETKRQSVWKYTSGTIVFSHDVVIRSIDKHGQVEQEIQPTLRKLPKEQSNTQPTVTFKETIENSDTANTDLDFAGTDIFNEISKLEDGKPENASKSTKRLPGRKK